MDENQEPTESEEVRSLVTVREVTALTPIPGADFIEAAEVNHGWVCVVKKGEFQVGSLGVYFEIDSFLPATDERFKFLERDVRNWKGKDGIKLKTIRLKKQLSQGLLMPLSLFPEIQMARVAGALDHSVTMDSVLEADFSELLGVVKWEAEIAACLRGMVKGNFPGWIPKTDEPRIQGIFRTIENCKAEFPGQEYEATVKIDGSSCTMYLNKGEFGVCSRNLDLKFTEGNAFWQMARKYSVEEKLRSLNRNLAIQGEVFGLGINGNWEGINYVDFACFKIWDIGEKRFLTPMERLAIVRPLEIPHVPILSINIKLEDFATVADYLAYAEGPSLFNPIREGVVFKSMYTDFSFKAISNTFLLKKKE